MDSKREWKIFGAMAAIFGAAYFLPLANPRVIDAVLEVPAGYAAARGWRIGDRVLIEGDQSSEIGAAALLR